MEDGNWWRRRKKGGKREEKNKKFKILQNYPSQRRLCHVKRVVSTSLIPAKFDQMNYIRKLP